MVLPINPGNIPIGPSGVPNVSPAPSHPAVTARQIQSFSGLPPSEDYIPKIYQPSKMSVFEFTSILSNSVDRLREILFFSTKVDEEITKRFYLANISIGKSSFNTSTNISERIFASEITDSGYINYINDGINGVVADMNNAIQNYILGLNNSAIDEENQIVNELNDAIQSYGAIINPSSSEIAAMNTLINNYNIYAANRNSDIVLYNDAVNIYNTEVGMPTITSEGNISYPSGSLNHQITDFNSKFEGLGLLEPLPYFQNLSERELLPVPLPLADPDPLLTSQLQTNLNTTLTEIYSPYSAYRALNEELNQSILSSPSFGISSDINSLITYYNDNYVALEPDGSMPISPTDQQAISYLNQAIENYNDVSSPDFLNINVLNSAISEYETSVNSNPNLNQYINLFNEEVVGTPLNPLSGFNNTIGVRINLGIDNVNSYLPSGIMYPSTILATQEAMPTAPLEATVVNQMSLQSLVASFQTPLISDRSFRPVILPDTISFEDIPLSYDPLQDANGVIYINQFPSIANIPTIPAPVTPDPYENINSYFVNLNNTISTYNSNVGDLINPVANSENDAIEQLDIAINQWNNLSTRTESDLTSLQNAIDNYNLLAYGGTGFTPTSPSPGSFNDQINQLNNQINYFNTSTDPSPAETLFNLNQEIKTQNIARNLFGLPAIPYYESKPLRDLMGEAPIIPSGSDPTLLSTYSLMPKRESYAPILNMTQFIIEANYLFENGLSLDGKIKNNLLTTLEQMNDSNFLSYQSLLDGAGSIPDLYNQTINNYLSASALNPGNMPAIALSGANVLLDPTTQNSVINDLLNAINQNPPLSQSALQQKIDEYNNYSSLVNTTISDLNAAISDIQTNKIGILDTNTGEYPPDTLNYYVKAFQATYGDNGLIGPLKTLTLDPIEEMISALPAATTMVTINGQSENIYNLANILNSAMQNVTPTLGNPSLNDLNSLIDTYNNQVGDSLGSQIDSENGIIFILNQAIQNTFPSDVSSDSPLNNPNVYFSALDNLYSAGQQYDLNREILNNGGTLGLSTVSGVNNLNDLINLFNGNTLNLINNSTITILNEINNAIQPFGFLAFSPLKELALRDNMTDTLGSQAYVPDEISLLLSRSPYPQINQAFTLPSRIAPTLLPEFFTLTGSNNDLLNLNENVYLPLTEALQDYNESIDDQFGLFAENKAIEELNIAIHSFNEGNSSSDDLKEAVSNYIQKISTDTPSINQNIHDLNVLIENYQTLFNEANKSLEFWGLIPIPKEFYINQRRIMPTAPIPLNEDLLVNSNYQTEVPTLSRRFPQNYPHTTTTISDPITGEKSTLYEVVPLNEGAIFVSVAKSIFNRRILFKEKAYKLLEGSLKRIELFDELQEYLRGRRIEFPNAYIEYGVTPIAPEALSPIISAAALSIGLTSNHFESLLRNEIFVKTLKHFELKDLGFLRLFQTLSFEINHKIISKSFGQSMLLLNNQVPFISLNAFRNRDSTPIAPVITASVIQQTVSFVRSFVTEEIVREILSPKAPKALVEAVSAAFNLSLISNSLVLVGNLLGKNVPKSILGFNDKNVALNQFKPNESLLNARFREEDIRNALIEARKEQLDVLNPDEINKLDAISRQISEEKNKAEMLTYSLSLKDATRYQQRKEAIKNEIISKPTFSNIEVNKSLEVKDLQEKIAQNNLLKDIDARDLANRTLKKLVERNGLIKEINHNELLDSLIKHKILLDDENSQFHNQALIVEAQRKFDRLQSTENNPLDVLVNVLQTTFDINNETASSIIQNQNILSADFIQSKLDDLNANLSEEELRILMNQRLDESLSKFDEKLRIETKKIINENLLNSDVSLKNLLHKNIKKLNDLKDDEISNSLTEEFKELFLTQDKPAVFLQKLLDPLYFGIYCIGAGLMYDKAEKGNYLRDIEIHI